ncbi:MAG: helix-turn-helix domain-containing protein [Chloroflexota bacterium]|nr:helix-turn-helix domain-containing protein [Chloroflexota bacterium]
MPTGSPPTKPKRQTWQDWMSDAAPDVPEPTKLLTREEFLAELNRIGQDVDEGTLRFWENRGVLPRGVRRWDPAVRARRAYYPPWMLAMVLLLRALQRSGLSLQEVTTRLRSYASAVIHGSCATETLIQQEETSDPETALPMDDPGWRGPVVLRALRGPAWPAIVVQFALLEPVRVAIADAAAQFARMTGAEEAVHAEVSLRDREGNEIGVLPIPLSPFGGDPPAQRGAP